jgi:hypothetical protein
MQHATASRTLQSRHCHRIKDLLLPRYRIYLMSRKDMSIFRLLQHALLIGV